MKQLKPIVDVLVNTKVAAAAIALTLMLALACMAVAQSNGRLSYQAKCAVCHGSTGHGDTSTGVQLHVTSFADPSVLAMSDTILQGLIVNGSEKMPAYKGKLPDAEVTNLIQYIHKLQTGQ